ncbi:aldehyde dehydrogenase family protein [Verrucomicrobium spinosum]|uniref:aldehyde dehydrogenase family protein n=1 Tax=Verrucomicrobium spinosum TaxID=2736 RepID=UPI00210CECED|nr:aldehyde dehydrogenase family protein [Verrucomicrobium spinosum]
MTLHGHSIIAGKVTRSESGVTFLPVNPSTGADLAPPVHEASLELADQALAAADEAFDALRSKSPAERAAFLDAIADGIEALGDALLERAQAETGLPLARLAGERSRTTGQARLFARLIREGSWQEARIDRAILTASLWPSRMSAASCSRWGRWWSLVPVTFPSPSPWPVRIPSVPSLRAAR